MSKKKVMDDLDALLADLQSTTSHIQNLQSRHEQGSREATPPPLPPHPATEDMYNHGEPLYEPQAIKQQMHSTTTVVTKVNNNPMAAPQRSSLSNNLSELDTLLQDLSSAQFMAEVDRRHSGTANGFQNEEIITPTKQAPPRDRTVDSLLDELDRQDDLPNHYEQVNVARHPNAVNMSSQPHAVQHYNTHQAEPHYNPHQGEPHYHTHQGEPAAGGPPGASTATRELDDLMASLSEFKMASPGQMGEPPYAQPHKTSLQTPGHSPGQPGHSQGQQGYNQGQPSYSPGQLGQGQLGHSQGQSGHSQGQTSYNQGQDSYNQGQMGGQTARFPVEQQVVQAAEGVTQHSNYSDVSRGAPQSGNLEAMLGNLSTDMSKQGVMTVPKGHCAACSKPIVGQVITALGRIWHPEHFMCSHCKSELGTRNFFERDGLPFCERDYHMLFSPRCASCNGPILDKCITALEKSWHPEHFVCAHCKRPFGEDGFHEREGHAYCRDDYFDMFAPKCGGCNRPIMDNYISALNKQWHPECFVCWECHTAFGASSFFDHEGFPFCSTHYHAKRGSLCAGCQKPITGRCITAMYKKFHPEHFVCAFCLKQLNKGTFKEQNDKPYCHPCFVKLFG